MYKKGNSSRQDSLPVIPDEKKAELPPKKATRLFQMKSVAFRPHLTMGLALSQKRAV
jgi:hypothetical protein